METKIMQKTERAINVEFERGRKAGIAIAVAVYNCIENWEETDSYKSAVAFLKDRLSFSDASISKYKKAVGLFNLTNKDSEWLSWNITQLCELAKLNDVDTINWVVDNYCLDDRSPSNEIREVVKDYESKMLKAEDTEDKDDADATEDTDDADATEDTDDADYSKKQAIIAICGKYKMSSEDLSKILTIAGLM